METGQAGPLAVAASVIELAQSARFAAIEELFAPRLRAAVSAETIRAAWTAELAKIGPVQAVGAPLGEPFGDGLVRVRTPVTGEHGRVTVTLATGIPEDVVRSVNLDYLDPASIDIAAYEADPETLVVPDAGEVLFRLASNA